MNEKDLNLVGAMTRNELMAVLMMARAGFHDFAQDIGLGRKSALELLQVLQNDGIDWQALEHKCMRMFEVLTNLDEPDESQESVQ